MRPTHDGYCNCPSCFDRHYPDNPPEEPEDEEDEAIARKIRKDIEQAQAERIGAFQRDVARLVGMEEEQEAESDD